MIPSAAPTQPSVGFLGKIPSQPDFVRQSVANPVAAELDAWLVKSAQNLSLAKAELPDGCVRFVFSAPKQGSLVIGTLCKSHDQVGRSFPLAIYAVLPAHEIVGAFQAVPLGFGGFFAAAEAVLDAAAGLSVEALRERVMQLQPPSSDALAPALLQCAAVLRTAPAAELFTRALGSLQDGNLFYALSTFGAATEAVRIEPPASAATVLACPISVDVDLLAWLDLAQRSLLWRSAVPSFAWVEEPAPRLLLTLGFASDQLLHFVAEPRHRSARLWPLQTESREAIARARDELRSRVTEQSVASSSLDALWTALAGAAR